MLAESAWPERAALLAVISFFGAVCLHGIADFWAYGHNGFMGAQFAQAARNTIRFGSPGQAVFHMGLTPPAPGSFYVNHPQLLHWHLVLFHSLLGDAEWVTRLTPVIYNLATLLLLFLAFRRWCGRAAALVVAASYSLVPLQMSFGNLVSHEPGGVFWSLAFLTLYLRWSEDGRPGHLAGSLAALAVGTQFDWPPYYFALFVAIHAMDRGLGRLRRPLRWQAEFTYAGMLSLVVLASFSAHYLFVVHTHGSFAPLLKAYAFRTSIPAHCLKRLGSWLVMMEGPIFLGLLVIWSARFAVRATRRATTPGDTIVAFFLAAQAVHSVAFQNAGYMHAYWLYYLGVAAAGAAGMMLADASASLRRWISSRGLPGPAWSAELRGWLSLAIPMILVGTLVTCQAPRSMQALSRSFRTGGFAAGPRPAPYNDQFDEIAWMRHLGTIWNRDNAVFLIHASVFTGKRIEWYHYLDAPWFRARVLPSLDPKTFSPRHLVLLADLARGASGQALMRAAAGHRVVVHQGRFVAVDLCDFKPHLEAWERTDLRAGPLWRWLVNPVRPPVLWVRGRLHGRGALSGAAALGAGR